MKTLFVIIVSAFMIGGCASSKINGPAYLEQSPEFKLEEFFDGDVKAWGIVQNRKGELVQRFEVDIIGTWEPEARSLTLDETFEYGVGDGVASRIWRIKQSDSGGWSGEAGDILGTATGQSFGNAFNWRYQMDLPVGDKQYKVEFDDWIWAFDKDTLVNRSYIRKFGITFAEVTIFMQRQGTGS